MATKPFGGRNTALARLLDEAGWSVARLANEVNREVGAGYISRTTVSEWLNWSRVPRQPLPTVVAHVLSQATGVPVAVSQLWPGVASSSLYVAADHGTGVSWDLSGTKALIADWLQNGENLSGFGRRNFMAVSGAALTAPAWQYVDQVSNVPRQSAIQEVFGTVGSSEIKVSPALIEYFRSLIAAFRRMDDLEGGSSENLKQVSYGIGQISDYLRRGSFANNGLAKDLLGCLAQMCQIGGWMAFDAERHGLAQRYFRTGLQAAQNIGDRNIGAILLACMTYQAANRWQGREAVEISNAAIRVARETHPLVRTVVSARAAHAKAAAGDYYGFRSSTAQVTEHFQDAQNSGGGPEYLYWFDSIMAAESMEGQSMIFLTLRSGRGNRLHLQEAERLLAAEVQQTGPDRPRDAFYHGAWLARAHVKRGDLHKGLALGQSAIDGMASVSSPRTVKVLIDLDRDLANMRDNGKLPEVRRFRKNMQPVLIGLS